MITQPHSNRTAKQRKLNVAMSNITNNKTNDTQTYKPYAPHVSREARSHYWAVAIGLQDVDGLEVSEYAKQVAKKYIEGIEPIEKTAEQIRDYHAGGAYKTNEEADLVSTRIAEILERSVFCLLPSILPQIHKFIFQDLDAEIYHPGAFKTERLIKQEDILNGDSVLYADPITYEMSLNAAFNREAVKVYTTFDEEGLKSFCQTIAFLWQVHPFYEGNTRTVAVFSELYLNHLGFCVVNEPFEKHSAYFRDALVRSMYRNAKANIFPDDSFLISFYENLLDLAHNKLDREHLVCTELFDNPQLLKNVSPDEAFKK